MRLTRSLGTQPGRGAGVSTTPPVLGQGGGDSGFAPCHLMEATGGGQWLLGAGGPCSNVLGIALRRPWSGKATTSSWGLLVPEVLRCPLRARLSHPSQEMTVCLEFRGIPASSSGIPLLGEPTPPMPPGPGNLGGLVRLSRPCDPVNTQGTCLESLGKPPSPSMDSFSRTPLTPHSLMLPRAIGFGTGGVP